MSILQRAYSATGTGPWCLRRTLAPSHIAARRALWAWLRNRGLNWSVIGRLTGRHPSTVLLALRKPQRSFIDPRQAVQVRFQAEAKVRSRHGLQPSDDLFQRAWQRKGGLMRIDGLAEARREVYTALREAGLSFPEVARVCGLRSHSGVVGSLAERGTSARGTIEKDCKTSPKQHFSGLRSGRVSALPRVHG